MDILTFDSIGLDVMELAGNQILNWNGNWSRKQGCGPRAWPGQSPTRKLNERGVLYIWGFEFSSHIKDARIVLWIIWFWGYEDILTTVWWTYRQHKNTPKTVLCPQYSYNLSLIKWSANITLPFPEHSLNGFWITFYQSISIRAVKISCLPCKFSSCLGNFPLFATSFCFHLLLTFFIRKHFRYVRTILQTCVKFHLLFSDSRVFPRSLLYFTSINILPLLALGAPCGKVEATVQGKNSQAEYKNYLSYAHSFHLQWARETGLAHWEWENS